MLLVLCTTHLINILIYNPFLYNSHLLWILKWVCICINYLIFHHFNWQIVQQQRRVMNYLCKYFSNSTVFCWLLLNPFIFPTVSVFYFYWKIAMLMKWIKMYNLWFGNMNYFTWKQSIFILFAFCWIFFWIVMTLDFFMLNKNLANIMFYYTFVRSFTCFMRQQCNRFFYFENRTKFVKCLYLFYLNNQHFVVH